MIRFATLSALVVTGSMLAGCQAPATSATTAASSRSYTEPDTGSLFSGGDKGDLSNGANDPGMYSHASSSGGK